MGKSVSIAGRDIDVSGVFPLKIKALRQLKEQHGITLGNMGEKLQEDPLLAATIVHAAIIQIDPAITLEQIEESLSLDEVSRLMNPEGDIDRPTSTGLTTSPPPTDGQPGILSA